MKNLCQHASSYPISLKVEDPFDEENILYPNVCRKHSKVACFTNSFNFPKLDSSKGRVMKYSKDYFKLLRTCCWPIAQNDEKLVQFITPGCNLANFSDKEGESYKWDDDPATYLGTGSHWTEWGASLRGRETRKIQIIPNYSRWWLRPGHATARSCVQFLWFFSAN